MGTSLDAAGQALNGDAWGLHDAVMTGLAIDYAARTLVLDLRLAVTERQDGLRAARFVVTGLVFCVMEPPHPYGPTSWAPYFERAGSRIDVRDVDDPAKEAGAGLPPRPAGSWCCFLYDDGLNTTFWIAGEDCTGTWTSDPMSVESDVHFPGETVDVPVATPHEE